MECDEDDLVCIDHAASIELQQANEQMYVLMDFAEDDIACLVPAYDYQAGAEAELDALMLDEEDSALCRKPMAELYAGVDVFAPCFFSDSSQSSASSSRRSSICSETSVEFSLPSRSASPQPQRIQRSKTLNSSQSSKGSSQSSTASSSQSSQSSQSSEGSTQSSTAPSQTSTFSTSSSQSSTASSQSPQSSTSSTQSPVLPQHGFGDSQSSQDRQQQAPREPIVFEVIDEQPWKLIEIIFIKVLSPSTSKPK